MTAASQSRPIAGPPNDRAIAIWLLVCCAMIFAMAVIGAVTRLTESGLSIMEWAPLRGILPPLGEAEWQRLFALYREIPEYKEVNAGMSLADFKGIFWWEYIHRLWGRLIGLVFLLPFLWFLLRGKIRTGLAPHLLAMFLLGGLQGLLGWVMVASGFAERSDVSQYRLTAHLLAALAIYSYIFWVASGLLLKEVPGAPMARRGGLRGGLIALLLLLTLAIASGGFVAGLNAGLIYNSFPLMDGALVPPDYAQLSPWVLNLFENVAAVQFNHRALAVTVFASVLALWAWSRHLAAPPRLWQAMTILLGLAVLQVGLGISTLLLVVPLPLAVLHQAGAIALLTACLWCLRVVTRLKEPLDG
ncbi:MAG TPA: COX15/CtaA family protein [Kiloniellaceae bacterium]|nr:COX15/CtaA family protein [Kiloniellaceae bacterium]